MKKIFAIILALAISLSLCACSRDVKSPGSQSDDKSGNDQVDSASDNTTDENKSNDDSVNTNDTSVDNAENNGNSGSDEAANAPESTENYEYADINISYGKGMAVTEADNGMASVEYDGCKLFVEDVTDDFNPNTTDAATYLYDYAYEKCVELVMETYGTITQFNGEYAISVSGNEIYGYGAHMTCDSDTQVYAFIKMVTLDAGKGYAVMIGICDEYNEGVFNNVEVK